MGLFNALLTLKMSSSKGLTMAIDSAEKVEKIVFKMITRKIFGMKGFANPAILDIIFRVLMSLRLLLLGIMII